MDEKEIKRMVLDSASPTPPMYDYRFWDSENKRTLLATGVNLAEYPEQVTILCVEEHPQVCVSSLDLINPEAKIRFQSRVKRSY